MFVKKKKVFFIRFPTNRTFSSSTAEFILPRFATSFCPFIIDLCYEKLVMSLKTVSESGLASSLLFFVVLIFRHS